MGVLDVLARTAGVAGAGLQGYGEDQQLKIKEALAQAKEQREAQSAAILDLLHKREAGTLRLGDPGYADAQGSVAGAEANARVPAAVTEAQLLAPIHTGEAIATAQGVSPIHTQEAVNTARGVAPIHIGEHETERQFDVTHPETSYTFLPGANDETGNPTILAGNSRTGQLTPTGQHGKAPVTRIESATNTAAKARLKAAISEMNNANTGMEDFESKLKSGQINISGVSQLLGRAANAFTHDDPLSQTIQATTLTTLNHTNPDLARYIRRALSFAEAESMISQRPSDFRTKMAAFLSAASSGASPDMISDIQSRRHSILTPLNQVNMEEPTGPAGSTSVAPTRAQQLWDAAVAKHGQATVLKEYGPRPNE